MRDFSEFVSRPQVVIQAENNNKSARVFTLATLMPTPFYIRSISARDGFVLNVLALALCSFIFIAVSNIYPQIKNPAFRRIF